MKKLPRVMIAILALVGATIAGAAPASADDPDLVFYGEAGAGTMNGYAGAGTAFYLLHSKTACDGNSIVGYRFAVYNNKMEKRGRTVDVYRNGYKSNKSYYVCSCSGVENGVQWGNYGYYGNALRSKDGALLSHSENRAAQSREDGFVLQNGTQGKYLETQIGLSSYFPKYTEMNAWLSKAKNVKAILKLCLGAEDVLNFGDLLEIEPIFSVRIASTTCGVTAADLARLFYAYYGDVVPAEASGAISLAWVRTWALKTYPNMLSVTNAVAAGKASLSAGTKLVNREKPSIILNGAYGMLLGENLSESVSPPDLAIHNANVINPESGLACEQLQDGTQYELHVTFSEEDSRYLVERVITVNGGEVYTTENGWSDSARIVTNSAETTLAVPVRPTGKEEKMTIRVREDWVSEEGTRMRSGGEAYLSYYVQPRLELCLYLTDETGEEISQCFTTQVAKLWAEIVNRSEIAITVDASLQENGKVIASEQGTRLPGGGKIILEGRTMTLSDNISAMAELGSEIDGQPFTLAEKRIFAVEKVDVELKKFYFTDSRGRLIPNEDIYEGMFVTPVLEIGMRGYPGMCGTAMVTNAASGEKTTALWDSGGIPITMTPVIVRADEDGWFRLIAEIWLEDFEGNASVEADPSNNVKEILIKPKKAFAWEDVSGAESFTEGEAVVSSIWLTNEQGKDWRGETYVRFAVRDGESGQSIYQNIKPVYCPNGEKTPVYFKWEVPGITADDLIKTEEKSLRLSFEISLDGGENYLLLQNVSEHAWRPYESSVCQNSGFEREGPLGFEIPEAPEVSAVAGFEWREWTLEKGTLYQHNYSLLETLTIENSEETIKSGGASFFKAEEVEIANCPADSVARTKHIDFLYADKYFSEVIDEFDRVEAKHEIKNEDYEKSVIIPLWYPNGAYYVEAKIYFWTPYGKTYLNAIVEYFVNGNLYDEYYIGRRP